ncbi:flagellar protein FlaG [Ectothiorhodospira mobilis]|uniref:Flagellar protein FlaG n=2 Tax=Ectothiorhodospira mobilis TaxID=195064 RepID=A0A1I4PVE4_ECTMO|nr:flagellar protein FlaG [Ectothiorhodospira mobilis]SFM31758.1 flagellar protein FlaG [Ectothiorhodospira mobilis]
MDTRIHALPLQPVQTSNAAPSALPAAGGETLPVLAPSEGKSLPATGRSQAGVDPARGDPSSSRGFSEQVGDAVQRINDFVQVVQRDLQFTVDEDTGRTVVKVFDARSEELIRQLPPEEILEVAAYMDELRGLLVQDKA